MLYLLKSKYWIINCLKYVEYIIVCFYYYYYLTIFKVWELCSSIFGENSTKDTATLVHATPSNIQVGVFTWISITDRESLCIIMLPEFKQSSTVFAVDWQLFVSQVQVWHAG